MSLIIATPVDGDPRSAVVSHGYHTSVRRLERGGAIIIPAEICFSDDLARARSRCVWWALKHPDWTHLLWWDDDVIVDDATIVSRMIETGYDCIGCPYPRKRIPAQFPYKPLDEYISSGTQPVVNGCTEVDLLGFGFIMTSRTCLEAMVARYEEELWFTDNHQVGDPHETVALFSQYWTRTIQTQTGGRFRELLGEDYSFCKRWRNMGGKVHMYVGEGAPLGHVGGHMFTGTRDELGRVR